MAREEADKEVASRLEKMKTITVDTTLHAWDELMEEYKVDQQAEWDPNYEIKVWREKESKLGGGASDEGRV